MCCPDHESDERISLRIRSLRPHESIQFPLLPLTVSRSPDKRLSLLLLIRFTDPVLSVSMNPNYEQIGKTFVQQYYAMFDGDATLRTGLANFYSVSIHHVARYACG